MERLRSWIRRLYSREGFRGPVVTLLSGTAVTLILSYVTVPILTRLFTPEEFGISDYFVMMVSVLMTVASLRYEDAIMLPEDDRTAGAVFRLAGLLSISAALVLVVATFFRHEITAFLRVEDLAPWLWMLAPTLLFMKFGRMAEIWLSRKKSFRLISAGEVTNKATMIASRIGAGAATQLGPGGLIGGFFLAYTASAGYYAAILRRDVGGALRERFSGVDLTSVARRYRRFPIFATPAAVLNALVSRLPVVLLPVYFTMETVGLFGRAFVALAVPLSLIGSAVSQVFFVHAAEAYRDSRLGELTESVHARLVMLGTFPMVLLTLVGPDLFEFVFGVRWRTAGVYEQVLAVWFFAGGVASPLTRLFDVLEKQRTELLISLVTSLALTAALVLGGRTGSVLFTMVLISAAGTLVRGLHIGTMMHLAGVPLRSVVRPYVRYLAISVPLALPVYLTRNLMPLWATALTAAAFGGLYAAIVLWREDLLPGQSADL